jgi:hypothetical protein
MADDGTQIRGPGSGDADPLLVRPFLDPDRTAPGVAAAATWPAPSDPPDPAPGTPAEPVTPTTPVARHRPRRTRRALILAGVATAVVIALGAAGLAAMLPDDDRAVPIPTGALPPLPTAATPPPGTTDGTAPTSDPADDPADTRTTAATTTPRTTAPETIGTATPPAAPQPPAPATTTATAGPTRASPAPTVEFIAPPATGRIAAAGGRVCLDLNGGVPSDGNRVQVYECNRSVAQVWTLSTDGALQVVGKCANVGGDDGVHIVRCDGRTTARWRAGADGTLVNAAAGRCLTDLSGGVRSGVAVRVAACGGGDNQRWSLP